MAEHTKGRLTVKDVVLFDDQERPFASTAAIGRNGLSVAIANARRLVAAWNACEGLTTEELEDMEKAFGPPVA